MKAKKDNEEVWLHFTYESEAIQTSSDLINPFSLFDVKFYRFNIKI